jgi:hypothetical protein
MIKIRLHNAEICAGAQRQKWRPSRDMLAKKTVDKTIDRQLRESVTVR